MLLSYSAEKDIFPEETGFASLTYRKKSLRLGLGQRLSLSPLFRSRRRVKKSAKFAIDWNDWPETGKGTHPKTNLKSNSFECESLSESNACPYSNSAEVIYRKCIFPIQSQSHSRQQHNPLPDTYRSRKLYDGLIPHSPRQASPVVKRQIFRFVRQYLRRFRHLWLQSQFTIRKNYSALYQFQSCACLPPPQMHLQTRACESKSSLNLSLGSKPFRLKENAGLLSQCLTPKLEKRDWLNFEKISRSPQRKPVCSAILKSQQKRLRSPEELLLGKLNLKPKNLICNKQSTQKQSIALWLSRSSPIIAFPTQLTQAQGSNAYDEQNQRFQSLVALNFTHLHCWPLASPKAKRDETRLCKILGSIRRNFPVNGATVNCVPNLLLHTKLFIKINPDTFSKFAFDSKLVFLTQLWFQCVDTKWYSRTFWLASALARVNIRTTRSLSKVTKE